MIDLSGLSPVQVRFLLLKGLGASQEEALKLVNRKFETIKHWRHDAKFKELEKTVKTDGDVSELLELFKEKLVGPAVVKLTEVLAGDFEKEDVWKVKVQLDVAKFLFKVDKKKSSTYEDGL